MITKNHTSTSESTQTREVPRRAIAPPPDAVRRLRRSERGRQAARDLLTLLDNGGVGLDYDNQRAVKDLLDFAWRVNSSAVISALKK